MIITLENDQDKLQISEELERLLTAGLEKYAASKNISVSWFIQNFKQYTNTTPAQYIQNLRLSNAKSLLETTNYNVTEISNLVGYENPLYFSRFFRKQFGASPSQFRKQLEQNAEKL